MGKLIYTFGTMGAGKTAAAIELVKELGARGIRVWPLSPAANTRGESGKFSSRNGQSTEAITVGPAFELFAAFRNKLRNSAIVVDEAQFILPYQVEDLRRLADEAEADVYCFGLRTDFLGRLFPGAQRLLELADEVKVLEHACECGRPAVVNARIGADRKPEKSGGVYEIGDVDVRYRPMCMRCWEEAMDEKEGGARR